MLGLFLVEIGSEGGHRVDFRLLQMRLVSHLRARVRNGELSERALARLAGISQPHVHNVLKGTRLLSADLADQILHRLRIDLIDLLDDPGADGGFRTGSANRPVSREVPLLDGFIGRDYPYPRAAGPERYAFPTPDLEGLESPVAARLTPDALRAPMLRGAGVVLLDRAERSRESPDDDGYFAVDLCGSGAIAQVRQAGRHLQMRSQPVDEWQCVPLRDRSPLEVIQGRVRLVLGHL